VVSKDSLTDETSFLDHAKRRGVRDVGFGLDSLKSPLGNRPASD
jgi:hypothetical protein